MNKTSSSELADNDFLKNIIFSQIAPHLRINANLEDAFTSVNRKSFLPEFSDRLGCDLNIFRDKIFFYRSLITLRCLKELEIKKSDIVLIYDNDLGYTASLIAKLCDTILIANCENKHIIEKNLEKNNIINWAFVDPKNDKFEKIISLRPFKIDSFANISTPPVEIANISGEKASIVIMFESNDILKAYIFKKTNMLLYQKEIDKTEIYLDKSF